MSEGVKLPAQTSSCICAACNDGQSWTPQKAAPQLPELTFPSPWGSWEQRFAFELFLCNHNILLGLANGLLRHPLVGVIPHHPTLRFIRSHPAQHPLPAMGKAGNSDFLSLYPALFTASAVITCYTYAKGYLTLSRCLWTAGWKKQAGLSGRFPMYGNWWALLRAVFVCLVEVWEVLSSFLVEKETFHCQVALGRLGLCWRMAGFVLKDAWFAWHPCCILGCSGSAGPWEVGLFPAGCGEISWGFAGGTHRPPGLSPASSYPAWGWSPWRWVLWLSSLGFGGRFK